MRRMQSVLGMAGLMLVGVLGASAADMKIAVVSMEKVIKGHADYEHAKSVTQGLITEFEAEIKDMQATIESSKKKINEARKAAENPGLSDAERAEKKSEAEELVTEFQKTNQEFEETFTKRKKEISEQERRTLKRIIDNIQAAIADYAKEHELTTVLDQDAVSATGVPTVLFAEETLDVTDAILKVVGEKTAE